MPVNLPVHVLSGKSKAARLKASQQTSGLFIMAWSQLRITDTDELLANIGPQLIIADEAHSLSNKKSATYKRVNRWMVQNPETEFVCLSGTMGKKSLIDYYHLMQWALKDKCPMPETLIETMNWANIIDTSYNEYTSDGTLYPMLKWAQRDGIKVDRDIAGYRKSFNHRLATSHGCVFSVGEDDLGTSITFHNVPVEVPDDYEGMEELQRLIHQLHAEDLDPQGELVPLAFHKFKYDYELTAGFYNSLIWPDPEDLSKRRKISVDDAEDLLERSKDYHRAHQDYNRVLRRWLHEYACEGLDTPMLLGTSMLHHGAEKVGDELFNFWETQRAFDFDERLDRDAIAVRVCDYKVKACLEWIKKLPKQRGGVVIWFKRTEMGKWMFELLEKAGVDAVLCNASKQGGLNMNNEEYHKSKVMVASISAYKEGINAQGVEYMYFLQMPREAHHLEQCIGRNHRTGTPYDE
jgi:hypothetical protein